LDEFDISAFIWLANGTEKGAASGLDQPKDAGPAAGAGLAGPAIDQEF
jgi:hypothetical protein